MMFVGRAAAAVLVLAAGSSGLLLPAKTKTTVQPQAPPVHEIATEADVHELRSKLSSVAEVFDALLKSEAQSLSPQAGHTKAKAWADVRSFVTNLRHTLSARIRSPLLAMEKLEGVKAEVPKYLALALGKPASKATSKTEAKYVAKIEMELSHKPASVTRTDVEALRSSFSNVADAFQVTQADVDSLRFKLKKASLGLQDLLGSKLSPLVKAHIEPEVKSFVVELHRVLAETIFMTPADALSKLEGVDARLREVTSDLSSKAEGLGKEVEAQKVSWLLGVLMTLQHAPMDQQLSVLRSADFEELVVCKALLEKHADNVPLYQQAELFLGGSATAAIKQPQATSIQRPDATSQAAVSNAAAHHKRVVRAQADIAMCEGRIASLAKDLEDRTKAHTRRSAQLLDAMKRSSGATLNVMEKMAQREEEGFSKFATSQHNDIGVLQETVSALKRDDFEVAIKAVSKLQSPIKSLQVKLESF